jgi:holliday junction DNA helicase RuvA
MIGKLKGTIDEIFEDFVLIDVVGVGYIVHCTHSLISSFILGNKESIHIQMIVRDDNIVLYGFKSLEEKKWFNILQTVQGVGAKVSLAILGSVDINGIQTAIAANDLSIFKNISGIGPKLASRIVNELKGKHEIFTSVINRNDSAAGDWTLNNLRSDNSPDTIKIKEDAISALVNLGFNRSNVFITISYLNRINPDLKLDELIKSALAELTSNDSAAK